MTEPKKERCGACTDGYITFVTDDGHLSLRTCRKCGGYGYVDIKPLTNEEYLRSLNTEQLADAIYDLLIGRQWDSWSWKLNGMVLRDIYEHGNTKSTKAIMEWLKQPHTQ